jgi:hypothetical protein
VASRFRFDRFVRPATGLVGLAIVALAAVPVVGAASPPPTTSTPSVPSSSSAPAAAGPVVRWLAAHPLLRGAVRGDVTVVKGDGTTVIVHFEVGKIAAVSGSSISMRGRDGAGATFGVTSDTRVRRDGHPIAISALGVGDRAVVVGTSSHGTYTAIVIRSPMAPPTAGG